MSLHNDLRKLTAAGETEEVLKFLLNIAENSKNKSFRDDVVQQNSRFSNLKRNLNNGTINDDFYTLETNKINQSLLDLIDRMPGTQASVSKLIKSSHPKIFSENPSLKTKHKENSLKTPDITWIIGLILILGTFIGLIGFVPCPTSAQQVVFRFLMALGGACVATLLPGLLNIHFTGIKATNALAFFVLIYLINPPKLAESRSLCDKAVFTNITIFLHKPGRKEDIVSPSKGSVILILDNERKESSINQSGQAIFQNIRIGDTVHLGLTGAPGLKIFNPDTFYIVEEHGGIYLAVEQISSISPTPEIPKNKKSIPSPNTTIKASSRVPNNGVAINSIIWLNKNVDKQIFNSTYCNNATLLECLYTWSDANKACKSVGSGWHLPSVADWQNLTTEVSNKNVMITLKELNFEPTLAGIWQNDTTERVGSTGYFWTAEEHGDQAVAFVLSKSSNRLTQTELPKSFGASCRCVYK